MDEGPSDGDAFARSLQRWAIALGFVFLVYGYASSWELDRVDVYGTPDEESYAHELSIELGLFRSLRLEAYWQRTTESVPARTPDFVGVSVTNARVLLSDVTLLVCLVWVARKLARRAQARWILLGACLGLVTALTFPLDLAIDSSSSNFSWIVILWICVACPLTTFWVCGGSNAPTTRILGVSIATASTATVFEPRLRDAHFSWSDSGFVPDPWFVLAWIPLVAVPVLLVRAARR